MLKPATMRLPAPLTIASPRRLSARLARLGERVLPPSAAMHLLARRENRWGEPELRLLPHLVPRHQIAVDVGAAEGVYTYFLSGLARECHAFEANTESAGAIRRRIPRARVHACALSDHQGQLELRIPIVAGVPYRGWATTQPTNTFSSLPDHELMVVSVPCATLDSFALKNVGFMKIDVEGHEFAVLAGATETLNACRPIILLEAEDRHRPGALDSLERFFSSMRYGSWFLQNGRLQKLSRGQDGESACKVSPVSRLNNFFFIPKERSLCDKFVSLREAVSADRLGWFS